MIESVQWNRIGPIERGKLLQHDHCAVITWRIILLFGGNLNFGNINKKILHKDL